MNEKHNVKVFLKNGFRYEGQVLTETERFLTIKDKKTGNIVDIATDNIGTRITEQWTPT